MTQRQFSLLTGLFEQAPNALVFVDRDGIVLDVNPAFTRSFGYTPSEICGQPINRLSVEGVTPSGSLPGPDARSDTTTVTPAFSHYRRNDGSTVAVRVALLTFRDEQDQGAPFGYGAIINDLSQSAAASGTLPIDWAAAASEQKLLSTLYRRTPAIMHSIDENGFIRTVSEAWLLRFGYTEDEVLGRKSTDFMTKESRELALDVILPAFSESGRCDHVPYTMIAKSGERVEVELSSVLDTSSGQKHTLAILEDVTERNTALRALESRNADLKEFAHVAAHDLQAPIRHIDMFTTLATQDLSEGMLDDLRDHLETIKECSSRLNAMVRALLDFSLTGNGRPSQTPCDMKSLIEGVVKQLEPEIEATSATVEVGIEDVPTVVCDPILVERVFANLVNNALKYVEPGVDPRLHIRGRDLGKSVEIAIEDNGIGIEPKFRQQVFMPLKRLHGQDSPYQGTGIGLALCRKIVSAHEGEIRVENSTTGQGSRFVVTLPKDRESVSYDAEEAPAKFAAGR